jgi:hypothetical protein
MAITGIFRAAQLLKLLIANSATFQTMVGAANATDAQAFIHRSYHTPSALVPPRVLILNTSDGSEMARRNVSINHWRSDMRLMTSWEILTAVQSDADVEEEAIIQTIGDIISDMEADVTSGSTVGGLNPLYAVGFSIDYGPDRIPFEERDQATSGDLTKALWVVGLEVEVKG